MNETTWKKEPAIEGKHGGCLNCGPRPSFFPLDRAGLHGLEPGRHPGLQVVGLKLGHPPCGQLGEVAQEAGEPGRLHLGAALGRRYLVPVALDSLREGLQRPLTQLAGAQVRLNLRSPQAGLGLGGKAGARLTLPGSLYLCSPLARRELAKVRHFVRALVRGMCGRRVLS